MNKQSFNQIVYKIKREQLLKKINRLVHELFKLDQLYSPKEYELGSFKVSS